MNIVQVVCRVVLALLGADTNVFVSDFGIPECRYHCFYTDSEVSIVIPTFLSADTVIDTMILAFLNAHTVVFTMITVCL